MAIGRKNRVIVDPLCYNTCLIGIGGIGKTTIINEMCNKLAGENGYLFAECFREDGADAIEGIPYTNVIDWNSEYDEESNTVGFKYLINDIIENKDSEYPDFRVLVIDTYDQLRELAVLEVMRLHNKQNPDKPKANSIKQCFGGYMAGDDMADDLILDALWELKKVNVHFILIGHVKQREIPDEISDNVYVQLSTDMSMRSFNKIKTKLHFLGVAYIDREIVKNKKNGKESGTIKSETRRIAFRDDNYAIDSKSRFADIVDDIPLDADELIKALTDAIEKEASKSGSSISDIKKEQKAEDTKRKQKASEYSENKRELKVNPERNEELKVKIRELLKTLPQESKDAMNAKMTEFNIDNFKDVSDIPTKYLEDIVEVITS